MVKSFSFRSIERFYLVVFLLFAMGLCAPQLALASEAEQDGASAQKEETLGGVTVQDPSGDAINGQREDAGLADDSQEGGPSAKGEGQGIDEGATTPEAPASSEAKQVEGNAQQQGQPQPQLAETTAPVQDGASTPPPAKTQAGPQVSQAQSGTSAKTSSQALNATAPVVKSTVSAKSADQASKQSAGVQYRAYVQGNKWKQGWKKSGQQAGTTGKGLRLESIQLKLTDSDLAGSIEYRVHMQNIGWGKWLKNGQSAGAAGKGLRMEAIQIRLSGQVAKTYEVVYRAHVQDVGWQKWVSAGATAGTTGRSLRVEALKVRLVERPSIPAAEQTVDNGLYTMRLTAATGVAIAPVSATNVSGANVAATKFNRWRLEDKWQVTWKGDGYELFNANSGKVLEAAGSAKNIVANVRQAKRSNSKSQRWAIVKGADGSYSIRNMDQGMALAVDGKLKAGANVMLWVPSRNDAQKVSLAQVAPVSDGIYQLFTKMHQKGKCADVHNGSVSNKATIRLSATNDGPNQHFIVAKKGSAYTLQAVSSGKYVTVSGSKIVQKTKSTAPTQLWKASIAKNGGLVFTNASSGKALSVKGNKNASGVNLVQAARKDAKGQRWYPLKRPLLSNGLYEMRIAPVRSVVLDVNGGSLSSGANAVVCYRNDGNNQKFAITAVKAGYYRICMPLGSTAVTVQGSSAKSGANVHMETYRGAGAQLWKPVVTNGGLSFVNKKSGKALSFTSAKSGANVRQATKRSKSTQKWSLVKTSLNPNDLLSYRMAVQAASGSGSAVLSNAAPGYSISRARWNQLINALNDCWSEGYDVGFVMMDCNTGMTVSINADSTFYGASTIKGLYVTYLFEEYLEKGLLSWGQISDLATYAITISDNDSYTSLRNRYGSESGFENWLNRVGVGYIGTWGSYTPRTLAKAWTHMLVYSASNGRYVSTWKSIFDHSEHSVIHESLGGYRTTYSKPGWMIGGSYGYILNDAGVVDDLHGRRYLLSMMSNVYSEGDRYLLRNIAAALDAIHMEMPRSR